MRRKLLDNTLTSISALCIFQLIRDFIQDFCCTGDDYYWKNIIITSVEVIIFLIILYNFYYKKRMLVDAFDLLKTMSQNNKLHPLREIVMVVNDQYEKSEYRYKVCNAEFQYILDKCKKNYDVTYKISLELKRRFFRKNNKLLKFYTILDNEGNIENNYVPVTVSFKAIARPIVSFITYPEEVTVSKIDHIRKFSSLYEISIQIPEKIIKRFRMNYIQCDISYKVKNNFFLSNDSKNSDYNFFVYPNNYGKKMGQCTVKVLAPKNENYNIVCYRFCVGNVAEKIFDLTTNEEVISQNISYNIFSGSFRPQKNAAYFINLNKIL